MSAFRDSLSPQARTRFDAAITGLADVFATACDQADDLYAREGAMGVGRAAWVPGGPSLEELAAGYERLAQQARERCTPSKQQQESSA